MNRIASGLGAALLTLASFGAAEAAPTKVKVFVASMFEIGANTGDRAGEFQHWYERYWQKSQPHEARGALKPVYCNEDGVCGAVLGMGKVNSSSSMQAILLDPDYDFSQAYFVITGVAGTRPRAERSATSPRAPGWSTMISAIAGRRKKASRASRSSYHARAMRSTGSSSSTRHW